MTPREPRESLLQRRLGDSKARPDGLLEQRSSAPPVQEAQPIQEAPPPLRPSRTLRPLPVRAVAERWKGRLQEGVARLAARVAAAWCEGPGLRAAAFLYLVGAMLATWPLPLHLDTHCWGGRFDLWGNLWLMHYFFEQLSHGQFHLTTPLIFYPDGFSLWGYGHFLLQLVTCPLLLVVSVPAAYTILLWLSLALSALALYHLAHAQTGNRWAALLAGALYTFHSLKYAEMSVGSVEQVATFGLPLFVWSLWRWWQEGTRRWWLATQALLIVTALCNWFYGIALTAFTVLFTVFHLVRRQQGGAEPGAGRWVVDRELLKKSVLLGVGSLILVSPALIAVKPEILSRPSLTELDVAAWKAPDDWQRTRERSQMAYANVKDVNDQDDIEGVSATLSHVTTERVKQTALRQTVDDALALDRVLAEDMVGEPRAAGPGFQLLLLGLIGLVLGGRRARFWAFAWASLTIVSLGPYLRLAEDAAPITRFRLPYWYLHELLPVMRVAYRPYRFQSMALVALAVLAAYGASAVLDRVKHRGPRAVLATAMLVVTIFVRWSLCSPNRAITLSDARIPPYYQPLSRDHESYALVEIPYHHWSYGDSNSRFQYYQTQHGKPILNNPEFINMQQLLKLRHLVDGHPLLLAFAEQQHTRRLEVTPAYLKDVAWMRQVGFRYLVVHTTFPRDPMHLSGFQERREIMSEAYLDFLEALFGPPTPAQGGLLFDVRRSGSGRISGAGSALVFGQSFERRHQPFRLNGQNLVRWNFQGTPWRRFAFWALAEADSGRMQVRLEVRHAGRVRIVQVAVPLDEHGWRRVCISREQLGLPADACLVGLELTSATSRPAFVSVMGTELL